MSHDKSYWYAAEVVRVIGGDTLHLRRDNSDRRYWYAAELIRVIDGDTLHLRVDLGLETTRTLTVRLAGINCPERGTEEGKAATEFTRKWLAKHGPVLLINTVKDRREKFGRYLAHVYDRQSGGSLGLSLLLENHATHLPARADA